MEKYKVDIVKISESIIDTLEDVYDNYEDAVEAGKERLSGYSVLDTIMGVADDSHSLKYKVRKVNKPSTAKIIPFRMFNSK